MICITGIWGCQRSKRCQSIRVSRGHLKGIPLPLLIGGGLLMLDGVVGMKGHGYGRVLRDCTFGIL